MKNTVIILFAALIGASSPAVAQGSATGNRTSSANQKQEEEPIEDKESKRPFWEASLPGGHFQVLLSRLVSISMHEYVLDGSVVVTEVTVDTTGQALPRFYYIEPVSDRMSGTGTGTGDAIAGVVDRGRELVERASQRGGTDIHNMVQKKYGLTTHTKTLEYRLLSMEELTALYNSVRKAWDTGRGRRITIR